MTVNYTSARPGYFSTAGLALLRGRDFTTDDRAETPRVAIVNETLASVLWPGADPIGRKVFTQPGASEKSPVTIVGIARDSKYQSVWEQPEPHIYFASLQSGFPVIRILVRTRGGTDSAMLAIRDGWDHWAPHIPLYDVHTGRQLVNLSLAPQRLAAELLALLSLVALILAALGIYCVIAYSVAHRTREIGIRIAIGARPGVILREIVGRSLLLSGAGLVLGVACSVGVMRFISAQLQGVSSNDGLTFGLAAGSLGIVSAVAAMVPALRGARIDPVVALRRE
jgi:putative ABC transport system permease protein